MMKFQNENAFFCISKDSFEIHFFCFFLISKDSFEIHFFCFFLKENLCELHLREQFFCRNKPINPVLIVRKSQYDYHAF